MSDMGFNKPSEEMDNPNSYWCQPDNNAPSIRDYSQSSRRKNYAEALKLKPCNGNKAYCTYFKERYPIKYSCDI